MESAAPLFKITTFSSEVCDIDKFQYSIRTTSEDFRQ